jgi:hypothetical protein
MLICFDRERPGETKSTPMSEAQSIAERRVLTGYVSSVPPRSLVIQLVPAHSAQVAMRVKSNSFYFP